MLDKYSIIEYLDLPFETLNDMINHRKLNEMITEYFNMLAEETGNADYKIRGLEVRDCCSKIFAKRYDTVRVVSINNIFTCKSKFCSNCLKFIQASRLNKMFETIQNDNMTYDLFHIVLTVPNVTAKNLLYIIDVLLDGFAKLIRYFTGNAKIAGLDFEQFGFHAAMRSLEITYNNNRDDYHPHIHAVFALKKGTQLDKYIVNKFSYDKYHNYDVTRLFSEFEITLQKLWRKIIDNITDRDIAITQYNKKKLAIESKFKRGAFTAKEIGELDLSAFVDFKMGKEKKPKAAKITLKQINKLTNDEGYSVIMDKVDESNIYEVFKYAFKLFDEDNKIMQYEQFKVLQDVMYKRRQVQCYGGWYDIILDDSIDLDTVTGLYYAILLKLEEDTEQAEYCTTPEELLERKYDKYAIISKKQIFRVLKAMDEHTLSLVKNDIGGLVETIKQLTAYNNIEKATQRYYGFVPTRYNAPDLTDPDIVAAIETKRTENRRRRQADKSYMKMLAAAKEIEYIPDKEFKDIFNM